MSLSHFDERSGIVAAETPWGRWWQTVSEVFVEINIPPGTPGKDCKIIIKPNYLECRVKDKELIKVTVLTLFILLSPIFHKLIFSSFELFSSLLDHRILFSNDVLD